MKLRGVIALALALLCAPAFAQTNPGTSPLSGAKGGTNNAFMQFTGPSSSIKTYTLPDASGTIDLLNQAQTFTAAKTFAGGLSVIVNQNAATIIDLRNTTSGTGALASLAVTNNLDLSAFGLAGSGYTGLPQIANRAYIHSGAANNGIILDAGGVKPIDFYINNARAGGFTSAGLSVDSLAGGSGANSTTFWRGDGTWATPSGGGGSGAWSNTRLAKSAAYTAVTGDCGDTIALGGSAFYTLTLSAASGYATACTFVIVNEDSTRGKTLAINGYSNFILWPLQSVIVFNQNNVWRCGGRGSGGCGPQRWVLPANTTMYIDVTNGSNSNDGLASGSGNALASFQQAYDNAADRIDFNSKILTFSVANGTYTSGINSQKGLIACVYLCLVFDGNAGSPSSVLVSTTSASAFTWFQTGGQMSVAFKNMKVTTTTSGDCFWVSSTGVYVAGYNLIIGPCAHVGIRAYNNAEFDMLSNFTIAGAFGQGSFAYANAGAVIAWQGLTVTLSGAPSWASAFVLANGGQILIQSNTWSGSATGPRYNAVNLGLVDTGTGASGCSALPGNAGGATSAGGVCN
ncbi:hypothetical protein I3J27_21395 [Bradyrhizobium xenonodulans]|uniref:Uncharacterized protein n=1 Tax=Bradyrhizobium xenonodulans TaxID=2736875 RepID=A0ABY7MBG9_9BRAD|nr:hypothetical protein [Bradyrhizobium xenonodulans]WBL75591.1 hypothetical protein I3J27_21395 [Bradyrhizobium xenonodulans]